MLQIGFSLLYCVKKPRQASALPWLFILSYRKVSLFSFYWKMQKNITTALMTPKRMPAITWIGV